MQIRNVPKPRAKSWSITLPFLPISVNRLYRTTEQRGKRALTEEAWAERGTIGMIAALSGFCPEDKTEYGVRVTFTLPSRRGADIDNYFKQLLDSVFGQEGDKGIVELRAKKRIEKGVRQTDMTIWTVEHDDDGPPEPLSELGRALAEGFRMVRVRRTVREPRSA